MITVEDGLRQGGVGWPSPTGWPSSPSASASHVSRVLGVPVAYIPHGKPDAILADLGLDVAGIVASAVSLMAADHPEGASARV